jgi:regulator of RNase E activity RraA
VAVAPESRRVSQETWEQLNRVTTATLTSELLERGLRNTFIQGLEPLRPDLRMVGFALTLRYAPAREDIGMEVDYDNETNVQRVAVEAIGPDDVLVVDARGDLSAASFGHILATRIQRRGAAGFVSDGALRDTPRMRELELPCYARAAHATTSAVAHHPVDMNVPIGCGGVLILPGDVIVGDAEGVVAIPFGMVEEVAADADARDQLETFLLGRVEDGASIKGVYPPDERTRAEYEAWRHDRGDDGAAG